MQVPPGFRTVLHVGCGAPLPHKLHRYFRNDGWREIRIDIDTRVQPDVVADICDLSAFGNGSADAVWSSHNLEHLHDHQVPLALSEFFRVLRPDGFVLLTMPDLETVARFISEGRIEDTAYHSPAGPITPLDIVFGYRPSIAAGNQFMAHHTGFTQSRLRRLLVEAGFERCMAVRGSRLDLWGIGLMPEAPDEALMAPFTAEPVSA